MHKSTVIQAATGQIMCIGSDESCLEWLKHEAEKRKSWLSGPTVNGRESLYTIGGSTPFIIQQGIEIGHGVRGNELFDTAWSGILAVILMPFVAPATAFAPMIFDANGDNYYEKNNIAKKETLDFIVPALKDTARIIDPTKENKEKFMTLFKANLEKLYGDYNLKVDFNKFYADWVPEATFDSFVSAYYEEVIIKLRPLLVRDTEEKKEECVKE